MRIIALDAHTLNPGDLSWGALERIADCEIYPRTSPTELAVRLNAEIVLTNKTPINEAAMAGAPKLKYIGVTATGYNIVDVAAAKARSITVTNVPGYGTASVAQTVFALVLELAHRTGYHAQTVRDGRWSKSPDFCYWDYPLVELAGRVFGVVGYGRIGQLTAQIAKAFGMRILVTQHTPKPTGDPAIESVDLETLLRRSDVVSLHCPLTPETKGLINAERVRLMKRDAFLINTSRGPLIVENDLAAALHNEQIAGAGLDVLEVEPPRPDNPLLKAPNCFITPHIAWATQAARKRLLDITISNIVAWLEGDPKNVVS